MRNVTSSEIILCSDESEIGVIPMAVCPTAPEDEHIRNLGLGFPTGVNSSKSLNRAHRKSDLIWVSTKGISHCNGVLNNFGTLVPHVGPSGPPERSLPSIRVVPKVLPSKKLPSGPVG